MASSSVLLAADDPNCVIRLARDDHATRRIARLRLKSEFGEMRPAETAVLQVLDDHNAALDDMRQPRASVVKHPSSLAEVPKRVNRSTPSRTLRGPGPRVSKANRAPRQTELPRSSASPCACRRDHSEHRERPRGSRTGRPCSPSRWAVPRAPARSPQSAERAQFDDATAFNPARKFK